MHSRRILSLACALGIVAVTLGARPAFAQADAVVRSMENMLMGPLDAVVSPYTAWKTLDENMASVETTGGKVATGIVGYPYTWTLYLVLAGYRCAAGLVEYPVATALWSVSAFKKVELSPFFDTSEAAALVDAQTSVMNFKFGGRWLSTH